MRLMIVRHAKAEKAEPGMQDRDRPLTPRGHRDAERIGTYLVSHALVPELAVVSPARRTRETWDEIAKGLPATPPVDFDERLYNAGSKSVLNILTESRATIGTLLVIGHNPGLHDISQLLIAAGDIESRESLNEGLPTAGLVVIDFAGNDWRKLHPLGGRLERFVTPHLLKTSPD